jgi:hypothetical protein
VFVPLAWEPFTRFKLGAKTVEIRNMQSPVAAQVLKDPTPGRLVRLRLGYSGRDEITRRLGRVECAAGAICLSAWARRGADVEWGQESPFFNRRGNLVAFECLPLDTRLERGVG